MSADKKYTDSGIEIKKIYSSTDIPKAFSTAEESNKRYHYLLEHGVNGLSVAFDLPTQIGYDSDHPLAEGEVGKAGVAIDSIEDMDTLLGGIPLDRVSTSMTINATAIILLALYAAVG